MPDPNLGQVTATAWENQIGKTPNDNIFNSRAFFYSLAGGGQAGLKKGAGFEGRDASGGGRVFDFPLEYTTNSTFKSYSEMEQLDTTRIDVFDAARYDWKINAGTVVWSDLEELRVAAGSGKIDLIAGKLENGKNSHIASMNQQLLGDGSGNNGKDMSGIKQIIATAPTSGTVGGINRANFSFWRNKQTSGTGTAFSILRASLRSIYNQCSRGGMIDAPSAVLTTRTVFEGYEGLLTVTERFTVEDKDRNGQGAFNNQSLKFKGASMFFDEDLDTDNAYMYNPKFLKLIYLKGAWMKMKDRIEPANQLAAIQRVFTVGNLATNNSRRLGVVTAIA